MTRVGITGHSDLTAHSVVVVSVALRRALHTHARAGRLVGVSCLAPGVDQLFATVVLELGGQLEVILPAPDYRQRQIKAADVVTFDGLLGAARSVRVMRFERSCRQAYAAANAVLLASVEMVIAVWDGRPPTRLGSTGDVVAAARHLGIPLSVIWPLGAARATPTPQVAEPGH
jgi:hypothetical protein